MDNFLLHRSTDWEALKEVVSGYSDKWIGFDAQALVENPLNYLITDGKDNFALFEHEDDKVYYGHYLFKTRGPENTFEVAKKLLGYFFNCSDAELVMGLTPVTHYGALNLNEKLGFKSHGIVETITGPHYKVSITKKEFKL